jgi:Flp pilus assembly protein TadG
MKSSMRPFRFTRTLGESGVAALEFAFVLPILLFIAAGLIDFGRAVWTQSTLDYAVQAAARCAAINPANCNGSNVAAYAASQAYGVQVPPGNFAVTTSTTICNGLAGVQVVGNYTFKYIFPVFKLYPTAFSATACYPT